MTGILGSPPAWLASSPTRWYLVFCEVDERRWWDYVFQTRPGFRHVYALRWDGWNWIALNVHSAYTDIAIVAATCEEQLPQLVEPGAHVLEVEAFRPQNVIRGRWWIGPMTCVEQVKHLLAIPVGTIFTPWQLYRYLTGGPSYGRWWRWIKHRRSLALFRREQGQRGLEEGQPGCWRHGHLIVRRICLP